jgi:hypothetical protein
MNTGGPPSHSPDEQPTDTRPPDADAGGETASVTWPLSARLQMRSLWSAALSQSMDRLPPRWRKPRPWILAATVLVILLAIYFGLAPRGNPTVQQTAPDTKTFSISNRPTLVFVHAIARVQVAAGPDGQVSMKENKNGITSAIAIHYAQHGDTILVTVDIESGLYLDTWVDFDVTVPRSAGLNLSVATGTLVVDGLNGTIALSNTNGAIWATNLNGTLSLKTESGSVNTDHASGQMTLTAQNGTITTTATRLMGHSTVRAESGTINFHGSLDSSGSCVFQNSNGAVGVTLPHGSAFSVVARTSSGSVNTDFPGINVVHQSGGTDARGSVGKPPRARLAIQTTSGSIDLHQGT